MMFGTNHNVVYIHKYCDNLNCSVSYVPPPPSSVQVDVFIFTCMHVQQIMGGMWVELMSLQQSLSKTCDPCLLLLMKDSS